MPTVTEPSSHGEMKTLVILLAAKGEWEYEHAYDVFDDLFAKVEPEIVVVAQMKPDSGPPSEAEVPEGLQRLKEKHGVKSLRGCFIKSNSTDDGSNNHWSEYIPEVLRSLDLRLKETSKENLNLHVSAGGFTVSAALYNISQILGCRAWNTIGGRGSDSWYAEEVLETPKFTPAQSSTLAKCAQDSIESGEPQTFTSPEMESMDGTPGSKGSNMSMKGLIRDGYLEEKAEKSKRGKMQYLPTGKGLLEGIFQLSKSTRKRNPDDPQTGIIITARADKSKEQFREFLHEHGYHNQFTKVGLVVVDFFEKYDLEEKSAEFNEVIRDLKGTGLVGGAKSCNGAIPTAPGQLSHCSFGLLSQLHSIISSNEGELVDWSILSTGVPAILRTNFLRYSQESGSSVIETFRGLRSGGSGSRGSEYSISGQDFRKHRIECPVINDIEKMRALWNWKHQYIREALATLLVLDQPIGYNNHQLLEANEEYFPDESQWQRMKFTVPKSKAVQKSHEKMVKQGAITDRGDVFELTEVGKAAARMIWIREQEW